MGLFSMIFPDERIRRAGFSLFALLIKYKSVCSNNRWKKPQRQPANYEKPQPDPNIPQFFFFLLRNSECDACGCGDGGGDSVDRYVVHEENLEKHSSRVFKWSLVTFPPICPLSPLCPFGFCLHFKVVIPPRLACSSVLYAFFSPFPIRLPAWLPFCLPCPLAIWFFFFPVCRCGKLNLSSLIYPGKKLYVSPLAK